MPTVLILSQFAYAKMPLTLPLEVFVDGKPAVGGTPLRKRPHLVSRDVNSPHHGRPLVKIVCDCDRYLGMAAFAYLCWYAYIVLVVSMRTACSGDVLTR
jgi:hypothetical protein